MHRRIVLLAAAAACLIGSGPASAQTTPRRLRGTVQSLDGRVLAVATASGEIVKITLAADYTVGLLAPTTIDKIKPGSFVGIVGVGPKDRQRAVVVSIFPPGGARNEAQFAWDSLPDSTMTNAPVESEVAGNDGHQLTVTLKGEKVQVTVPPNAIIVETEPGTQAQVTPGSKVIIFAQAAADGQLTAARVNVGKDGFTPPM